MTGFRLNTSQVQQPVDYLEALSGLSNPVSYSIANESPQQAGLVLNNQGSSYFGGTSPMGVPGGAASGFMGSDFMKGMLGSTDTLTGLKKEGWGGTALDTAQGLFGGYMSMKNYGAYKDAQEQGKKQFQMNYDAQKTMTNARVADQWESRESYAKGSAGNREDYMKSRGIA